MKSRDNGTALTTSAGPQLCLASDQRASSAAAPQSEHGASTMLLPSPCRTRMLTVSALCRALNITTAITALLCLVANGMALYLYAPAKACPPAHIRALQRVSCAYMGPRQWL